MAATPIARRTPVPRRHGSSPSDPVPAARGGQLLACAVARLLLVLGATALLAPSPGGALLAAPPPAKIALTGARIIPVVGDPIAAGTILIEDGVIRAVGAQVEIPYDAVEVDLSGEVVLPGLIDPHNWRGLDIANENLPVAPFVDVYDAIDPSRLFFEETLRNGVTSVHVIQGDNCVIGGVSRVVRPIGLTPDEMTQRPAVALKMSTSPRRGSDRMVQMGTMRAAFDELDEYLGDLAERLYEKQVKERDEVLDVGPEEARKRGAELIDDGELDDAHRNLVRLREGRLAAWVYAGRATDVAPALATAEAQGFIDQLVLVLGTDAYRAVGEIKSAGRPVVLPAELVDRDRDPITGEVTETFLPRVFYDAGVPFALQPSPDSSLAERYLTYQAARCVREGIPRRVALEAITIRPARMLGLDEVIGSIEVGKRGNLTVFSGDPLDFSSWVERVYIDGILAYERSRDPRIQDLLPKPPADEKSAELHTPDGEGDGEEEVESAEGEGAGGDADPGEGGGADGEGLE